MANSLSEGNGYVKVFVNDQCVSEGHNDILTLGRNWIADMFRNRANVIGLTTTAGFCAAGYSGNTTTAGMLDLVCEAPAGSIGRTTIGSLFRPVTGSTLYVTTWFYDSGAIGPLREFGLFATGYSADETTLQTASSTKDSGILVARTVRDLITHNAGDDLRVEWRLTL